MKYVVAIATVGVLSVAGFSSERMASLFPSTVIPATVPAGGNETGDFSSTDVSFAQEKVPTIDKQSIWRALHSIRPFGRPNE